MAAPMLRAKRRCLDQVLGTPAIDDNQKQPDAARDR
jgi:hypothetical protein